MGFFHSNYKSQELCVIFIWIVVLVIFRFNCVPGSVVSSTIYTRTNENVTFKWKIPNDTMTSDLVITNEETDQIVFLLDVINQSVSDVNSLQQDRIKMAKIVDGLLTFIMIDVKLIETGYYVIKQYNDVITEQLLVVLDKPTKPVVLVNDTAVLGRKLKLWCMSESRSRPEYHGLTLHCNWTRNGQMLLPEDEDYLFGDKYLIIRNLTFMDIQVNYTCKCFEENGPVSDDSEKAVFELEIVSNEESFWIIIVTVVSVLVFLMISIIFGLVYRKTRTGLFGFRKNRENTIIYSQGYDVNTNRPPEIGTKAAAVLGGYEIARKSSRRTSGKIVDITEDRVLFKVVVKESDDDHTKF